VQLFTAVTQASERADRIVQMYVIVTPKVQMLKEFETHLSNAVLVWAFSYRFKYR